MSAATVGAIALGASAATGAAGLILSSDAAGAAGKAGLSAAQQQITLSQQALQAQIEARASGIKEAQTAAQISPGEIQAISNIFSTRDASLSASLQSISKQQSELDAMDPQVKAAGSNLYDLLTGKSAAILAPIQQQLGYQRSQMQNQLASQMGPGYMTSSAGIEAMTKFDTQASLALNSAQMNAITTVGQQYGSLSGIQQQGQNAITGQTLNAYGQAQGANIAAGNISSGVAQRGVQATLGAMSANPLNQFGVPAAQGSVIGTAGGPFAGGNAFGQGLSQTGGGLGNIGGYLLGKGGSTSGGSTLQSGAFGSNLGIGGSGGTAGSYLAPAAGSGNLGSRVQIA